MSRLLDLLLGGFLFLVTLPIVAFSALLIRIEGGGPAIYRQTRVGRGGEEFELLKLRTMVPGSDPVGIGTAVSRDDPRVIGGYTAEIAPEAGVAADILDSAKRLAQFKLWTQ